MPRMGNTMAAQSQLWKDSQAPGGDNPYKSGLSVRLPGVSPGLSGRDHEDSCGCSSISVHQLTGSDKAQHTVENGNSSADALALYLILPAHRKPREASDAFFSASRIPAIVLFFCFSHHHRPRCSDNS